MLAREVIADMARCRSFAFTTSTASVGLTSHDAVPEGEAHSLGADGEPSGVLCREVCREVALNLIEDLRRHPQLVHSEIETGEQEVARQNWDQSASTTTTSVDSISLQADQRRNGSGSMS